jgi:hypothetical protein
MEAQHPRRRHALALPRRVSRKRKRVTEAQYLRRFHPYTEAVVTRSWGRGSSRKLPTAAYRRFVTPGCGISGST